MRFWLLDINSTFFHTERYVNNKCDQNFIHNDINKPLIVFFNVDRKFNMMISIKIIPCCVNNACTIRFSVLLMHSRQRLFC